MNSKNYGDKEILDKYAFELYLEIFKKELPIGESFDLLERKLKIGGRRASMFFVDGLTDGEKSQRFMAYLMGLSEDSLKGISTSQEFIETAMPFLDTTLVKPKKDGSEDDCKENGSKENSGYNRSSDGGTGGGKGNRSVDCKIDDGSGRPRKMDTEDSVLEIFGKKQGNNSAKSDSNQQRRHENSTKSDNAPTAEGENGELIPLTFKVAYQCYQQALPKLYAGLVLLIVEGLDNIIVIDCREYPSRSVEEPEKEKTLRGAKDGFTENMMDNISLIRRRIRDNNLIFKAYNVGSVSKADVVVTYMNDRADERLIAKLDKCLKDMSSTAKEDSTNFKNLPEGLIQENDSTDLANESGAGNQPTSDNHKNRAQRRNSNTSQSHDNQETGKEVLSVADQSLLERLLKAIGASNSLNPFPKVRYTQRPDVIAAHLAEGKVAIIVDNSPTVMLIPVSVFEFFQDVDDYYFPQLTGNYFRLLRIVNFLVILFLTPIYLLITEYQDFTPEILKFFVPEEDFAIPIFWQFILLEIAVDALKLASLNTPTSLGMSLSVIGALILGEFSIESGWFISQTILCMAVVALAAFTQPSIELSYAMKFCRIFMLIGAATVGIFGVVAAAVIWVIIMASTKTLSGSSYLYPIVPFNWKALKRLIFRTQK